MKPAAGGEVDAVLEYLGPMGKFACLQAALYFSTYLIDANQMFSYVFTAQEVEHNCSAPTNDSDIIIPELHADWLNNTSVHYGKCSIVVTTNVSDDITVREYPCVYGMQYAQPRHFSYVSELDLVCEWRAMAGLTQTLLSLGAGIGSMVIPTLSDMFGRKRIVIITVPLMLATCIVTALAPNYAVLIGMKCLTGFFHPGGGIVGVIACLELFPSNKRAFISGFTSTWWWVVCMCTTPLIAFLLSSQSWRYMQLALSASALVFILVFMFAWEPVRWLVANGREQEAERCVRQAAKCNNKDPDTAVNILRQLAMHHVSDTSQYSDHPTQHVSDSSHTTTHPTYYASDASDHSVHTTHHASNASHPTDHLTHHASDSNHHPSDTTGRLGDSNHHQDAVFYSLKDTSNNSPLELDTLPFLDHHNFESGKLAVTEHKPGNDKPLFKGLNSVLSSVEHNHELSDVAETKVGFGDLFCHPRLRFNTLVNYYMWFTDSVTYNALYLTSASLAFNVYLSFFLNAVVEGASCILMILMMDRMGRRQMIGIFHVIAGVGLISSSVCFQFKDISSVNMAGTVLSLCGKMGIGGAFNVLFLYTPETYPTNIRNRALGVALSAATIGSMVAPYSNILAEYAIWAPGALFGSFCLAVVFCLMLLPETRGRELPQSLRELETWYDTSGKNKTPHGIKNGCDNKTKKT